MSLKSLFNCRQHVPIGMLLRAWLIVMLAGWFSSGAMAKVTTSTSALSSTTPSEPLLVVSKSSFNAMTGLNTYEFYLRLGTATAKTNGTTYSLAGFDFYLDDVSLIDKSQSSNLERFQKIYQSANVIFQTKAGQNYTGSESSVIITGVNPNVANTYMWVGDISTTTSSSCWAAVNVKVTLAIDKHWSYKNTHTLKITGKWGESGSNNRKDIELTSTLSTTNNGFPSASGTLKRTANGKVTYTIPTLTSQSSKDNYEENNGSFTWQNKIYLLKEAGKSTNPETYITNDEHKWATISEPATGGTQVMDADNYQPFTVYPCMEMVSPREYYIDTKPRYYQHHYKYYDGITAKGFPRPTNINVETYNAYSKEAKITWSGEVYDPNNADTEGKWVIFRKETDDANNSTFTKIGTTTNYFNNELIDKKHDIKYGQSYTYYVVFQPKAWNTELSGLDDATGLSGSSTYEMKRDFTITDLTALSSETSVKLTWKHSAIADASTSHAYSYEVQRTTTPDVANSWAIVSSNLTVTSSSKVEEVFDNTTDVAANTTYYYRVVFKEVQGVDYISSVVYARTGSSIIESLTSSRGNYSNMVKLTWTVKQVGTQTSYFTVQRRPLGSDNEEDWIDIYTTHGTASTYSYDDQTAQPGSFNEYRVILTENVTNGNVTTMEQTSTATVDGFCMARGVVSGRVSFGSGTAVKNVRVTMRPSNSNGTSINNFRSLRFNGQGGQGIKLSLSKKELKKLFGGDFTMQMWVKPDGNVMGTADTEYKLLDIPGTLSLSLVKTADGYNLKSSTNVLGAVDANTWSQITCVYSKGVLKAYVSKNDAPKDPQTVNQTVTVADADNSLTLANVAEMDAANPYAGNLDEVRVFNYALSEEEIQQNWNHTMAGSENGLLLYWSLDEGIEKQTIAYDFSKQNGVTNGHHGFMSAGVPSSNDVPSDDQLSLMAYTDADGNYMIGGVPFSGDGTNYVLTPTLGIHQFSPANQSRYFSINSLIHSGSDFEDVSSFPVSGKVYYKNTTIPVADVYVKVDGLTASKDGEPVKTNSKGEFSVDVPIGEHFVSLSLNGHTFDNEGRYPEDPNDVGTRIDFNGAVTGLTFYDNTLVTVAGRVAGGDLEEEKPLGLGQGNANIGKAVLTLNMENDEAGFLNAKKTVSGTSVSYDINDAERVFDTSYGTAKVPASKNYITVETDPTTGEWVAQLPPLRYKVTAVTIPAQENDITFANLPVVDASNPNLVYTDSVETETGIDKFEYVAGVKIKHKSEATFIVTENEDGSFGIKNYTVKDVSGDEHTVDIYTVNGNTINYKFGYPVYEEMSTYTYHISASERYINKDGSEEVVDEVPLVGKQVTVQNPFASTAKIICENATVGTSEYKRGDVYEVEDNTFELDSLGKATYEFTAGYPNIQEPYTRGITISYENNGAVQNWSGNAAKFAIVLGALPTGNNFVTQGPDEITMVLRDPPGTNSSATWTKGSTSITSKSWSVSPHSETSGTAKIYAGTKTKTGEGVGFMVIQDLESRATISIGGELNVSYEKAFNNTTTTTATRDISTSDGFDFNGVNGDLFIGSAKNLLFGACHYVDLKWDDIQGQAVLTMEDGIATGEEFTTGFAYSQNYVKNTLIPNFITLRNSLLKKVAPGQAANMDRPDKKDGPIYVTELTEDDPKFGTSNNDEDVWGKSAKHFEALDKTTGRYVGPSYTMILPAESTDSSYQDMVNFYNIQIKRWEDELKRNEEAKVTAIENSKEWLIENHSFDAGASITVEKSKEKTHSTNHTEVEEANVIIGAETGFTFTGVGLGLEIEEKVGLTFTEEQHFEKTTTNTVSYTLAEDGDDDYLTVDVFEAPDGFGPIFYTRGGATSCPYEDEVVTEYYKPGTVIMQKTVQIEKPEIEAQSQTVTGIPAGGKGTFKVNIRNNSDTGEDGWYDISVVATSNPDGLIVKMDGLNITAGRSILVPAGETMEKTLTVEQSKPDVLSYENIQLRLGSQCQKDNTGVFPEIASYTSFSAYFQPSCSEVNLATNHTLINTETKDNLVLSISGYDYSMTSLQGIRLQYKGKNDADFTTLHEYIRDYTGNEPNKSELKALTGNDKQNFSIDLRDNAFKDQTYVFRAITVCNLGGEVNNESEEVEVVRDMTRPMLIATPSPASGVLGIGDDLVITFNEDIQSTALTTPNNFDVVGVLNETAVTHEVALNLTGENTVKTQSTIDLSGKSFAANLWLNYTSDGQLLMHGMKDNNFTVSIENGKLAVTVDGDKKVSTASLPQNKWLYLNVSYDADDDQGILFAGYAADADKVTLINTTTKVYTGNGPVSVGGNNLQAKVQELSLWDGARSMTEAQKGMYESKSQFTSGLLGYWQLNEGHGDVAVDKARSRNMTLPSENAWWINGDNYALILDGTKAAAVNISSLNTTASEDYLVEAWFKASEDNNVASVLSTEVMDLRLNAQGKMELVINDENSSVTSESLRDGQWHHVAVNVLKSTNGSGIVYVDGVQRKQVSASAMPALYGAKLLLGSHQSYGAQGYSYDQMLKGAIDEVRIWKARRTADVIKNNMFNRVKNDVDGLVAYYPMEQLGLDAYSQVVTTADYNNVVPVAAGQTADALTFYNAAQTEVANATMSKDNTAALKTAPSQTNVEFDFVASERQIKVNLTEQAYKMEGCNIYITAKNIKDIHGNTALPITWSVYVQQNSLAWADKSLSVNKTGNDAKTFTATIENRGSQSESWSLSGMPEWLSANVEGGILTPLSNASVTFTVAGSLPIGTYETAVYLTGSQNINAPMNITVSSEGNAPDWVAVTDENTMTVIGQLKIDDKLSNDSRDMVAAFRGTQCVGVARPKYFSRYDAYLVMMNVYGLNEADLTYKAYDASTGMIYPSIEVSDANAYSFAADKAVGSFAQPVIFTPKSEVEQDLSMSHDGWKWFSIYANPVNNAASEIFKNSLAAIEMVTDGENSVLNWTGELNIDSYAKMYKLKAKTAYEENIVGAPADPTKVDITLKANGWSWIGYPAQASNSLAAAFADANPQEGDMVKNQSGFSVYTGGEWVGTLTAVIPGDGYLYNSTANTSKTFHYPVPQVTGASNRSAANRAFASHAESNMTMIAVVMDGSDIVENAQVSVYAGTSLRGSSVNAVKGNRHFITIGGEKGIADVLTYVVRTEDGQEYMLQVEEANVFEADAKKGSLHAPCVLQLSDATGLSLAGAFDRPVKSIELIDAGGRVVRTRQNTSAAFAKEDLKSLPNGVYYQKIIFMDGQSLLQKVLR